MSAVDFTPERRAEAERRADAIRQHAARVRYGLYDIQALVAEAKAAGDWKVLRYRSWPEYLAATLGDEPLRLERSERQELVGYLAGEGMSTRAIAGTLSVSKNTITADLSQIGTPAPESSDASPAIYVDPTPVTGLDGKQYPRHPKPASKPPEPDPAPFVARYPELQAFVDRGEPEKALRNGAFLDSLPEHEVDSRREAIRAHISAAPIEVPEDLAAPLMKALKEQASVNVHLSWIDDPAALARVASAVGPDAREAVLPVIQAMASHAALLSAALKPRLRAVK